MDGAAKSATARELPYIRPLSPKHWPTIQQRATGVAKTGVVLTALSVGTTVLALAKVPNGEGSGWLVAGAGLAFVGTPLAAGGSLRARRAALERGATLSGARGIALWVVYGSWLGALAGTTPSLLLGQSYGPLVVGLVGAPPVALTALILGSTQLSQATRANGSLASLTLLPVITQKHHGVAIGLRF